MSESEELLFFDTFAHGTTEELNLDLVQFPKPVYINQVRVIPLGAKVQADFPGGVRLGATNPSQFKLELFVNDLSKPGASAFETLGVLDYNQNSNIHYDSDKKVPTDGLVLRGLYTTVTLAVYGVITRAPIISIVAPPPVAPVKPESPIPVQPEQQLVVDIVPVLLAQAEETLRTSTPAYEEKIEQVKSEHVLTPAPPVAEVEVQKEEELDKETKVKVEEKIVVVEKVREKSRRSDELIRTRDASDRDWDSERTSKVDSDRTNRSDHRSRHEPDRSKNDSDRTRSDSERYRNDVDRNRSESDRDKSRTDSERKRIDPDRTKSERNDSDRTRGDNDRSKSDSDRSKGESSRSRNESDRTRVDKSDMDRTRSDSDRGKCDQDRVKADSERVRTDDRSRNDRDRDRDRERRADRSDRKERSKERDRNNGGSERDRSRERSRDRHRDKERAKERGSRESSRRPRTPADDKKPTVDMAAISSVSQTVDTTPAAPPLPTLVGLAPPSPVAVKKEEPPAVECFSPGVEMEAISDDDMLEVDNDDVVTDDPIKEGDESDQIKKETDQDEEIQGNGTKEEAKEDKEETSESLSNDRKLETADETATCNATESTAEAALESVTEPEELEELEEILSDEDLMFEDYGNDMADMDMNEFADLFDFGKPFNPYSLEPQPLQHLTDPASTLLERVIRNANQPGVSSKEVEEAAQRLQATLELTSRGDKWIDGMSVLASVLINGLAGLQGQPEVLQSVHEKVIDWLLHGLDFDLAREQPGSSTHTVRHIKCGLNLSQVVAQCCSTLVERCVDLGVLSKIVNLYGAPHMALSLKLMCLRSLDALLSWPCVMDHWLKQPVLEHRNGHDYLVALIESTQPSRAQVSVTALIRKIQTYQALQQIFTVGQTLARMQPPCAVRRKDARRPSSISIESHDSSNSQDSFSASMDGHGVEMQSLEPHRTQLLDNMHQVRQVYLNPLLTIGHFVRFLPVYRQYEISSTGSDPLQGLYAFLRHHRFFNVVFLLLTHPLMASDAVVMDAVFGFLEDFSKSQHGLCFLSSQSEVVGLILRALMHQPVVGPPPPVGVSTTSAATESVEVGRQDDYSNMEELPVTSHHPTSMTPHRLGVQLAHSLHVIQCVDALNHHVTSQGRDCLAAAECIQSLYSLVFSVSGRLALIDVLALDNNLDIFLNILNVENEPADGESKIKDSAVRGYAVELVSLVVRSTENATFYAKYCGPLNALLAANVDESSKLVHLTPWLEILSQSQIFTLDSGLPVLCDIVKQHADTVSSFPPEIVVALRLLCPLAIPKQQGSSAEEYVELKYAYAVVQLFSQDMLSVLVGLLTKLCQAYEQPAVHGSVLAGPQGVLLLSIVHPSLKLIRRLLCQLIRCRDSDFKDLTAVPVLLQTYALVSAVPASCLLYHKVSECCSDIVATLLAYSQPLLQTDDSGTRSRTSANASTGGGNNVIKATTTPEDALSRSLWTQMIQEILKYVHSCSGPAAFITGLQVLNEILPLPLPLHKGIGGVVASGGVGVGGGGNVLGVGGGREIHPLSDDHVQEILNARKLWSVHLHTLGPQIQQVVRLLCCCGPQLLQLLRKVCIQISDLSASTALVIARAALDAVLSGCLVQETGTSSTANVKAEESDKDPSVASLPSALIGTAHSARVLNFLAAIVTHPPIKAAVLQLCRGLQKSDEKYSEFLQCLCLILNSVSTSAAHVQSQECVVSIFQALLDADICLLSSDKADYDESYLSAALPSREPIVTIIAGLWDHLANTEHNYSSLLPTLRTLTLLTEHNYTFHHLHKVLERKRHALWAFFDKMAACFNKDSSDCLSTLSTALELLRTLVKTAAGRRSVTVPISTLSEALQWRNDVTPDESTCDATPTTPTTPPKKHPLLVLQDFLRESCTEEESMESLRDNVSALIDILETESDSSSRKEPIETIIPLPEPLNLLFTRRPILSETADEERLMSSYWLSSHHHHHHHHWAEEPESETDHVRCDLLEIAQSCLGADVDLVAQTERIWKSHTEPTEIGGRGTTVLSIKGRVNSQSADTPTHGRAILSTARDTSSRPYVAPMRGRGFGRPGVNGRNDPFRSRAPNTSRPPSLHVDDFVALEKNGAVGGSSSSSGVGNNLYGGKTQRGARGGSGNRGGRGSFSSNSDRGRFNFQPPRREVIRSRPGGAGGSASSSSTSGGAKWDDPYLHSSLAETRSASRFPSTNRVWTSTATKERYGSPSSSSTASSANRTRHTRTYSR